MAAYDEQVVKLAPGSNAWSPPPSLCSSTERTRATSANTPLKRISIELSRACNLRCVYCYAESSPETRTGLSDDEVRFVIAEAVDCGACLVSIVGGGEPLLQRSLIQSDASCIGYANGLGCYCYLYTNCTMVDDKSAQWLYAQDVSVIGKLNSLQDDVQDALTGVPGSALRIRRGIDALLRSGFSGTNPSRLGLETIICRQNYDEMPEIWRWMRARNIVPEVEIPTLHGRALANRGCLDFSEEEAPWKYQELFEELLVIDRTEFGFGWIPHPPFAAMSCRLYDTNCYVNDRGGVQPCAGMDREYGFLRVGGHRDTGQPMSDIVGAEEFKKLRDIRAHLQAPCAGCELLDDCYGCRGKAWHATGNVFAGDPVCWRRRLPGEGGRRFEQRRDLHQRLRMQ
ncbi:MAG: radical SAM protein [Armatimonadetes bacterium]|nr:radical SAM protein [Armatimonadota bacterium]